jgi:hypothetical protein
VVKSFSKTPAIIINIELVTLFTLFWFRYAGTVGSCVFKEKKFQFFFPKQFSKNIPRNRGALDIVDELL